MIGHPIALFRASTNKSDPVCYGFLSATIGDSHADYNSSRFNIDVRAFVCLSRFFIIYSIESVLSYDSEFLAMGFFDIVLSFPNV